MLIAGDSTLTYLKECLSRVEEADIAGKIILTGRINYLEKKIKRESQSTTIKSSNSKLSIPKSCAN